MSLGRKQRIDNNAWLEAVATIEDAVSREELDELTAATVADIKATTAGKRAAYAWSAGQGQHCPWQALRSGRCH